MAIYEVKADYASTLGTAKTGDVIELSLAVARAINRDQPGTLRLTAMAATASLTQPQMVTQDNPNEQIALTHEANSPGAGGNARSPDEPSEHRMVTAPTNKRGAKAVRK